MLMLRGCEIDPAMVVHQRVSLPPTVKANSLDPKASMRQVHGGATTPQRNVLTGSYAQCQRAHRSAQWYIAIAAAAPAFRDRVEPY